MRASTFLYSMGSGRLCSRGLARAHGAAVRSWLKAIGESRPPPSPL
jgi:hypothetical protein